MSFIPTVTCRRCGHQYSGIHRRCPNCGTRRVQQSGRTPAGTSSTVRGTAANGRAAVNAKWQMVFGLILVAAIIIAVIVLVTVSLNGEDSNPAVTINQASSISPTPTPTPTLTPTPTPTVTVTSIKIRYYNEERKEFAVSVGGTPTPINAEVYPKDVTASVEWAIADSKIASINVKDDGTVEVKGVKSGNTTLTATCGGITATCKVYVKG